MFERLAIVPPAFLCADQKRLSLIAYLFLVMLCTAFFVPGIATMPVTDRDEASFAQASKQMVETGNYTDIKLQDVPRYKKPIGIYWLQSISVRLFDPNHLDQIWAYRIPSFIGATISVLMTAAIGSLLFSPTVGLLAAIMLAGSVLLNVEARLAKTDAALLACIMMAMFAFAKSYLSRPLAVASERGERSTLSKERVLTAALFWTAIAFGILIKGPIVLLPVTAVLIWLKITDKNLTWCRHLFPVWGTLYMLALISPWFIAISLQSHGAFIEQSAGHDMFAKILHGQDRGILPPGLHLMALPIAYFPFALFILFAAPDAWKGRHERSIKFCLGWIIPTWIVFELSLTKLPHYVLPTYPAIALLTAKFLIDGFPTLSQTSSKLPTILTIGFWIVVGMGFAVVFSLLPIFVDQTWKIPQIIAGFCIVSAQGVALLLLPRQKIASFMALAIGALLFTSVTFGLTIPSLQHIWMSREIVEAAAPLRPCADTQLVAVGYHEPSLVFLAGTKTVLAMNSGEAAADLRSDKCDLAVIDQKHRQEFLDAFKGLPQMPVETGSIDGLNTGHGTQTVMSFFMMPQ